VFVWDPALGSWTTFRGAEDHPCVPGPYVELTAYDENEPLISFVRMDPYPVVLDDVRTGAVDECVPGEPHPFCARFRTRWLDAGAPTWKKSWRRPDLLLRGLEVTTTVNVQVFHDYDYGNAERSFVVAYTPDNFPDTWGSFVYGDGTTYGGSAQTTSVERGGTMGRAGAVQLLAVGNPGDSWGVNGIIFKYIPRRFR
jgi:hypothetical protein